MNKWMMAALAGVALVCTAPAAAQELPLVPSDYWDVQGVKIDDGHMGDYADFLASDFRKESEFAKSKGWMKAYFILDNVNPRADEPSMYLVRVYDHIPTAAEGRQREKELNAYMRQTTRQGMAQSGARASYRHLTSNELLQVLTWAH